MTDHDPAGELEVWHDPTRTGSSLELAPRALRLATSIANTEFVPDGMRGHPDKVLAAILWGREVGLTELAALQAVHIIKGRIGTSAESMRARIIAAGHRLTIDDMTATRCTITAQRSDGGAPQTFSFTADEAKRAKLGGDNWAKYPAEMLLARCTSRMARAVFPDVLAGLSYTPEELDDSDQPAPITATTAAPAAAKPKRAPVRTRRAATTTDIPDPEPPTPPPAREVNHDLHIEDAEVIPEPAADDRPTGRHGEIRLHDRIKPWADQTITVDNTPKGKVTATRRRATAFLVMAVTQSRTAHSGDLTAPELDKAVRRITELETGALTLTIDHDNQSMRFDWERDSVPHRWPDIDDGMPFDEIDDLHGPWDKTTTSNEETDQ